MVKNIWSKINIFFENPKKVKIIVTILIITNILTVVYGVSNHKDNSPYANYLSSKSERQIAPTLK
ncbi:hypothetical protein [Natranaerofaba carboxydovora]|uniref:hypothetical protein n=1 Tax=Natranaerofaba carboxydovora TaxID=2742683 RepID=UPI001F145F5A|nr:hypothetical protein [Natranaerofaba carboxydovora]UMZ74392.1 hypothetical protein ACONDI_01980 [Natranaerofaba carboxydovora]